MASDASDHAAPRPHVMLRHCSRTFRDARGGELRVIDDVSFEVRAGEIVSLIGPSGCGKTTLLRIIAGLVEADGGELLVDDAPVTDPPSIFALVFQDARVLPWKTVRANVEFALELKHHRRLTQAEREECEHYISAVGLQDFMAAYPYQLSGGMKQRVGVARALVRKPEVLLLDEPFGALDAQTRIVMQDLFLTLQEQFRVTSVLVTHDIDEAVYMSSRCLVLTGRPASLRATIDIDLPWPRQRTGARNMPELVRYRAQLWDLLKP
jgi:ABC-type nitrate/sulfonate/bicarbonate transport system ATPase subunit